MQKIIHPLAETIRTLAEDDDCRYIDIPNAYAFACICIEAILDPPMDRDRAIEILREALTASKLNIDLNELIERISDGDKAAIAIAVTHVAHEFQKGVDYQDKDMRLRFGHLFSE